MSCGVKRGNIRSSAIEEDVQSERGWMGGREGGSAASARAMHAHSDRSALPSAKAAEESRWQIRRTRVERSTSTHSGRVPIPRIALQTMMRIAYRQNILAEEDRAFQGYLHSKVEAQSRGK